MIELAWIAAAIAVLGLAQSVLGWRLVCRFAAAPRAALDAVPPITVLKPLYGAEPLLEEALSSLCRQDYGPFQIVLGVHDAADPALLAVQRIRQRFPRVDIAVVADPRIHGRNGKVSNLVNMMEAARHDVLVIADSDVHSAPDYLARIAAALARPGVGLVTTVYAGVAATRSLAGALGASGITHTFLPGALLGRALGRQDCLGATMALRRDTLAAIGGFQAIADEVADDAVLGRRVRALGLTVALAGTVPATTVPERALGPLFTHERRWGRTILSLAPLSFALSSLQYALAWALLALLCAGGAEWALGLFGGAWLLRGLVARGVDGALRPIAAAADPAPLLLLPLRDLLSMAVLAASYTSPVVRWRGEVLTVRMAAPHMVVANPDAAGD
jgi:ceramide glucosyltransferase